MGKHKTDRTEELRATAKRYIIAEEACNRIEQHNFDRLVKTGVIRPVRLEGRTLLLGTEIGVEPPLSVIEKRDSFLEAGVGSGKAGVGVL